MSDNTFKLLIGGALVIGIPLALAWGIYDQVTCAKWEETGSFTCHGDEGFQRCDPVKVCVERKK